MHERDDACRGPGHTPRPIPKTCSLWDIRWLFRLADVDSLGLARLVKLEAHTLRPIWKEPAILSETGREAKLGASRVGGARDDVDATRLELVYNIDTSND